MAYGVNSPFGLRPYGHLISGVNDIKVNSNYTISANSQSLNKGDPVMYTPQGAQYAVVPNGYQGKQAEIMLYYPTVTLQQAGTPTTIAVQNGVVGQSIVGVFQGCEYYTPNGTYVAQEYWQSGTATNGRPVIASIIDDPYVIYDIQLGTYMGSLLPTGTQFLTLPALSIQAGTWPNTGAVPNASTQTIANSAVIGSNIALMTGTSIPGPNNGVNNTLTNITLNGLPAGIKDNPLMANQGTALGNPWGISTFYACPTITACLAGQAGPAVINGANEYERTATTALKVIGYTPDPRNIPGAYGYGQGNNVPGNYFNTPFLNVLVTINNHINKAGTLGLVIS